MKAREVWAVLKVLRDWSVDVNVAIGAAEDLEVYCVGDCRYESSMWKVSMKVEV